MENRTDSACEVIGGERVLCEVEALPGRVNGVRRMKRVWRKSREEWSWGKIGGLGDRSKCGVIGRLAERRVSTKAR